MTDRCDLSHSTGSCQHKAQEILAVPAGEQPSASKQLAYYLNMITRVALGAIAVATSATLFVPFFVGGVALGLYHHHYSSHVHQGHDIIGCGQGFMESIANMHFPVEISLLANLGVTVCHLDHHPTVFVPYTAIALGMWVGQLLDSPLSRTVQWFQPTVSLAQA